MDMISQQQGSQDAMTVGSFLRDARSISGLTQKQVAEEAEIGLSAYKQYERDGAMPPLDKAGQLAEVLNFDPRELFNEIDALASGQPAPVGRPRIHPGSAEEGGGAPAPVKPASLADVVREQLSSIDGLREAGKRSELRSGKRIKKLQRQLMELEPEVLYEIFEERGGNLDSCPSGTPLLDGLLSIFEEDQEEGNKVCGVVSDRVIDTALLGVDLWALSDDSLDQLDSDIAGFWEGDIALLGWDNISEIIVKRRKLAWSAAMRGKGVAVDDPEKYPRRD